MNADLMEIHAGQCNSVWRFSDVLDGGVSKRLAYAVSMFRGSKAGVRAEAGCQEKGRKFFGCGFGGFGVRGLICATEVQKLLLLSCSIIGKDVSQNSGMSREYAMSCSRGIYLGNFKGRQYNSHKTQLI